MPANTDWRLNFGGQEYVIPPRGLRIGREPDNDIVIADDQISRHHALLWNDQGVLYVRDEGSTNGTFVNGKRISTATPLRATDRLQLGRALLKLRRPESADHPIEKRRSTNTGLVAAIIAAVVMVVLLVVAILLANAAPSLPNTAVLPTREPLTLPDPVFPSLPSGTPAVAGAKTDAQRAAMAAVLVVVPTNRSGEFYTGSGSIVDGRGLILTSFHVVRDEKTGAAYNRDDAILVLLNSSTDRPPDRTFRAQVAVLDRALDLAVIRLSSTENGGALPADLGSTGIPIGDSDRVQIGDRIQVVGFPGVGGNTVTLTEGIISGFLKNRTWVKTSAPLNRGNSGGLAINAAGELIGVPTEVITDPDVAGQMGLLRPINLAKPIIEKAK